MTDHVIIPILELANLILLFLGYRERVHIYRGIRIPFSVYTSSFSVAFCFSWRWCTSSNERGFLRKVNREIHKLAMVNPMTIFICKLNASPYTLLVASCCAGENCAMEYEDCSRLFNWAAESLELSSDLTKSKATAVQIARPTRPPRTRTWVMPPWDTATGMIKRYD